MSTTTDMATEFADAWEGLKEVFGEDVGAALWTHRRFNDNSTTSDTLIAVLINDESLEFDEDLEVFWREVDTPAFGRGDRLIDPGGREYRVLSATGNQAGIVEATARRAEAVH